MPYQDVLAGACDFSCYSALRSSTRARRPYELARCIGDIGGFVDQRWILPLWSKAWYFSLTGSHVLMETPDQVFAEHTAHTAAELKATALGSSCGEEACGLFGELFRKLEVRAVPGIRVEDQPGIR